MNKFRNKLTLSLLLLFSVFILCFISLILIFFTKADLVFFSYSISGIISDESAAPIANAEILIDDEVIAKSSENGEFKLSNLSEGTYSILVRKDDYVNRDLTIEIKRSFLKYNFNRNITLTTAATSAVKGKFIVENPTYQFVDDRIIINQDKTYTINSDGTFNLEKVPAGEINFVYSSNFYKDINETITLKPENNTLQDITLSPAGDIEENLVSYITETTVDDLLVVGEGIEQNNVNLQDGMLKVKDLDVGKVYNFRVTASGYEPRDYSITIQQGINKLPSFRLVEEGNSIFRYKSGDSKDFLFYKSDFDGADLENILAQDVEATSYFYNSAENIVYIATEQDRFSGVLGGRVSLIYSYNLNTKIFQKLTTNTTGLGLVIPQYLAQKIINISSTDRRSNTRILEIRDFQGNVTKTVESTNSHNYTSVLLSADSNALAVITQNSENIMSLDFHNLTTNSKTNIATGSNISLHAISDNGKRVIYSANRSSNSFTDLLLFDIDTNERRSLIVDERGINYQFYTGSDNLILYWDSIQNQTDLFSYSISENKVEQVTRLSALDKIVRIYQQNGHVFYITNRGLYIIDIANPKSNKIVLNGEFIY